MIRLMHPGAQACRRYNYRFCTTLIAPSNIQVDSTSEALFKGGFLRRSGARHWDAKDK